MEKNRKILHTILVRDEYVKDTYDDFETFDTHYFRDAGGADKIYSTCKKATYKEGKKEGEVIFGKDINRFYELYACDLSWAKKTTYCGGGNTTTSSWDNYPCVVELVKSKGVSKESNNSYIIGDFRYFPNGRKGIISTGKIVNFTCNDSEFIKSNSGGGNTGGGGNVSQDWLPDPTGNQTWEYQVRNCKWIARKKGQTQEYIISDEPKYASSVQILNTKYPTLLQNCNKPSQTQPVTPNVVTGGGQQQVQVGSTTPTGGQSGVNQSQGLGVPNSIDLGLDEIDKLVNPVKPETVTQTSTPTTQQESIKDNVNILKEEFYSTLKKIS
jgi:hypothetical protein